MTNRTLTATAVERLRAPTTGQADHFDQGYPGLALRVSYGGARTWVYSYRLFGKQKRMKLGRWPSMSLSAAREACWGLSPLSMVLRASRHQPQPTASQQSQTNGSNGTKPTTAPAPQPNA